MNLSYLYLVSMLFVTAAGQISYKLYFRRRHLPTLALSVVFFLLAVFFSYLSQRGIPMDTVYMTSSMNIVLVLIGSSLMLGEKLTRSQIFGSGLIILGIILYNF